MTENSVIFCIVNSGFGDAAMDAARSAGATGGTIMSGHGTTKREAAGFFNIEIDPQKEVVMIVVSSEIRDEVLHSLYKAVGLDTPAHGIAYSLPVDEIIGVSKPKKEEN